MFDIQSSGEKANLRSKEKVVWVVGCPKRSGRSALIRKSGSPEVFLPLVHLHHTPRVSSWEQFCKVGFLPTVARGVGISDVGLRFATDGALTGACPPEGSPHRFPASFAGRTASALPSFPRQPQIRPECHHGSGDQPPLEALQTCWSCHRSESRASTILSTFHTK